MRTKKRRLGRTLLLLSPVIIVLSIIIFHKKVLGTIGQFVVMDEHATPSDAIVVLFTGTEYYPRLLQAAELYRNGQAPKIIINGNRKTDILRQLESQGFTPCCAWYADYVRILKLYGVPESDVIAVSAEDVYDSVSEAAVVGPQLISRGYKQIIVTTSKFHTRRAGHIWKQMYAGRLSITVVAAKNDPYAPQGWWHDGRQIRWVLAEYGAWAYYGWKRLTQKRF